MPAILTARTREGFLAARVHHLVYAMIPNPNGTFSIAHAYPARDPATVLRTDLHLTSDRVADDAAFIAHVQEMADHYDAVSALSRERIDAMISTPWGGSQTRTRYSDGIESVTTPGHGGFLVSPELNDLIDPEWRSSDGTYEEDECWAIVAHTFPHLFTAFEMKHAHRTLKNGYPDTWERLTGTVLQPGESRAKDERRFANEHANDLIVISAIRSGNDPSKVICEAARGGRFSTPSHRRPPTSSFIVDREEYDAGYRPFGFIIDEHRHPPADRHGNPLPLPALN